MLTSGHNRDYKAQDACQNIAFYVAAWCLPQREDANFISTMLTFYESRNRQILKHLRPIIELLLTKFVAAH